MSNSPWIFRNTPVVAAASGTQAYGRFLFSVYYNVSKSEASCSLAWKCGIDGFDNEQLISLVLRPEQILACDFCHDMGENRIAPEMLALMPTIPNLEILHLAFRLTSSGAVQCPIATLPLDFSDTQTLGFAALSKLCQSNVVDVYVGKGQLSVEQQRRLEDVANRLSPRPLRSNAVDLRRLRGGRGAQEAQWGDVYLQSSVHETDPDTQQEHVLPNLKRHRGSMESTQMSDGPFAKMIKCYLDEITPGSPTEANTSLASTPRQDTTPPSNVLRPSPSHRTASVGSDSKHMNNETSSLQADTPLPAYSDRVATDSPSTPTPLRVDISSSISHGSVNDIKPTSFLRGHQQDRSIRLALSHELYATLQNMVQDILPGIVAKCPQSTLGPMMDARLESFAHERIDNLVREQVSNSNYQVLQENMDEFLNHVYWNNKQAEFELGEVVDQGKVEIYEARDMAMASLEDCALQHIEGFEDKIEEQKNCALEYVAETTEVLVETAVLLKKRREGHGFEQPKSLPREGQTTRPRRTSI